MNFVLTNYVDNEGRWRKVFSFMDHSAVTFNKIPFVTGNC